MTGAEQFAACSRMVMTFGTTVLRFTRRTLSGCTSTQPDSITSGVTETFAITISRTFPDPTVRFPLMEVGAVIVRTGTSTDPFTSVTPEEEQVVGSPGIGAQEGKVV